MGRIATIVVLGLFIVHCSKQGARSYRSAPAPAHKNQLGFIVTAQPTEIESLEKSEPQAGIRALTGSQNLYEVNNIDEQTLASYLHNKKLFKNVFMKSIAASEQMPLSLERLAKNTSEDAISALQTCQNTPQAPAVDADVSLNTNTMTIQLGESVTLTAKGTPNPQVGGSLRYLWDMLPPGFSKQSFEKGIADSQTFTPDSPGFYQVALIAQGTDLSCNFIIIPVLVTANPEVSTTPATAGNPNTKLFQHLDAVKAREIWNQTRGSGIVVAVLDSGINYNHPAIRENIQTKKSELNDQTDNDSNGLTDDFMGWDFVHGDNLPFDDEGHGTHVSGLIASPISGVAPDAKILPVKVLNPAGSSDLATVIAGIFYAVDSGAQIINMSLGFEGPTAPPPLLEALEYARTKNVLVLVAAGNGDSQTGIGYDIKNRPDWPAAIQKENMISVAATALGKITSYSNFSSELVHLGAPGGNEKEMIVSLATLNPAQSEFAAQMGTSMATPVTAGVAALIKSAKPSLMPSDIKTILMETGDSMASLEGRTVSGKQVNAANALKRALDLNLAPPMN